MGPADRNSFEQTLGNPDARGSLKPLPMGVGLDFERTFYHSQIKMIITGIMMIGPRMQTQLQTGPKFTLQHEGETHGWLCVSVNN